MDMSAAVGSQCCFVP